MEQADLEEHVHQLIAGFDLLQVEYRKLFGEHKALESRLATAREQYSELAKFCGKTTTDTPPLSLSSIDQPSKETETPDTATAILHLRNEDDAARTIQTAIQASQRLRQQFQRRSLYSAHGVRIWSGPSADQSVATPKLPSITESPMEQDFTIEGTPSKLGCPFASMAGRKLSSHAASVLSRYNGSTGAKEGSMNGREDKSAAGSTASRINGRDSISSRNANSRRRTSFADPIKAEICGLDSHSMAQQTSQAPEAQSNAEGGAEAGVCPIRFLDQHSPEEMATYFERHKHELPRSHEVCVRRYQSNEASVRELDARYGSLAQMIRGLGEKHITFMPKEPDEESVDGDINEAEQPAQGDRVRNWASNLSARAIAGAPDDEGPAETSNGDSDGDGSRESRFDRPLRDIRVGESPSRPWGIHVPIQYLDKAASEASTKPAQITPPAISPPTEEQPKFVAAAAARCPFAGATNVAPPADDIHAKIDRSQPSARNSIAAAQVTSSKDQSVQEKQQQQSGVTFMGPVFIGYSAEDAAKFLREAGLGTSS